jgi:hypothetical protein
MKRKIIGIFIVTLLVATALSVAGTLDIGKISDQKEITNNENEPTLIQSYSGLLDDDWFPQGALNTDSIFHIGNVGIGISNPSYKLHVMDRIGVGIAGSASGAVSLFPPDGSGWYHIDVPGGIGLRFSGGSSPGYYEYLTIAHPGNVGIGTMSPNSKLEVNGIIHSTTGGFKFPDGTVQTTAITGGGADDDWEWASGSGLTGNIYHIGNVGVGTDDPDSRYELDVRGDAQIKEDSGSTNLIIDAGNSVSANILFRRNGDNRWLLEGDWEKNDLRLSNYVNYPPRTTVMSWDYETGNVGIGIEDPDEKLVVDGSIKLTGGSDIAEPFEIKENEKIKPGMIVVIDAEKTGGLKISNKAYDRCVAGVVSGAGGINPGLMITQENLFTGMNVALAGRVYALCDANYGTIDPGDLLTTSPTPGYAMKVMNYEMAQGAILGKAMSSLENGRGLVLILVTLQ